MSNLLSKINKITSVVGMSVLLGLAFSASNSAMDLPENDLKTLIFSHCSPRTLGRIAQVSKEWNRLSAEQKVWWFPKGLTSRQAYEEAYTHFSSMINSSMSSEFSITAVFKPNQTRDDLEEREIIVQHGTIKDVWLDTYNYERADQYPWLTLVYSIPDHKNVMTMVTTYFFLKYIKDPLKVNKSIVTSLNSCFKECILNDSIKEIKKDAKKYFEDVKYVDEPRSQNIQRERAFVKYAQTDLLNYVNNVLIPHAKKCPNSNCCLMDVKSSESSENLPVDITQFSFWKQLIAPKESWE